MKNKNYMLSLGVLPLLLTGCMDVGLELPSGFTIQSPQANSAYIGFADLPSPNGSANPLPPNIVIEHDGSNTPADIFLNGYEITANKINNEDGKFTIVFADIKDFIRQGDNTVAINPKRLGPSVTFSLDSAGPDLVIKHVCLAADTGCAIDSSEVKVDFSVNDISNIHRVTLQGEVVEKIDGLYQMTLAQPAANELYEFVLEDEHGYVSEYSYMPNGAELASIFKARIGESAIKGLTPVIDAGISNQLTEKTDQEVADSDYLYAGDYGILKLWVKVKSMATGSVSINSLNFDDNEANLMHIDLSMIPAEHTGYTAEDKKDGQFLQTDDGMGGLRPINKEEAGTYMVMDIYTTCIWADHPDDNLSCKTKMMADMTMLMETMDFTGSIDLKLKDGQFAVAFRDGMKINMGDIATAEDGTSDFIGQIINMLKDTDLFQNLTKGLVETVINENLDEIAIAAEVVNDDGYRFDLQTTAQNVTTDADDMFVHFSGRIHTVLANPNVPRSLGSYYVKGDLPEPINDLNSDEDNLAVTVNANIINQALTSLYSTGNTHINIMPKSLLSKPKLTDIYLGPGAIDDAMGYNYNLKLELIPSGPGMFKFSGDNTSQASLTYHDAELRVASKVGGQWKDMFVLNVHISAGVLMHVRDDKFYMTISGSPDFKINSVVNHSIVPISDGVLTWVMDSMIGWAIPQIAQTELEIDIPDIEGEGYDFSTSVTTQEFNTDGGHLNFSMGLNPVFPVEK